MARRGRCKPQRVAGDGRVANGLTARGEEFLEWLRTHNYTEATIRTRRGPLSQFILWCAERGLLMPEEITKPVLERYQHWLAHKRKQDGQALSFTSQKMCLIAIKRFFRWLTRCNILLYNPASELEMPRVGTRLPSAVLTISEAEAVLAQPDLTHPLGLRDRAILETFYSTGLRRSELTGLSLYDLDRERGTLMIRQGKGRKDRLIPIGERALAWIDKYLREVRPKLVIDPNENTLFLTNWGTSITRDTMSLAMAKYVKAAQIGKSGSCHIFRHTMATLMLENGADTRFIQVMLGHADSRTTEIYTHVAIRKLKEIHTQTHPGANLKDPSPPEESSLDEAERQAREELRRKLYASGAHIAKPGKSPPE